VNTEGKYSNRAFPVATFLHYQEAPRRHTSR